MTVTYVSRRVVLAGFAASCAAASPPPPTAQPGEIEDGAVLIDGKRIAFRRRTGRGPTIVFESGLGDGLDVWAGVIERLPTDAAFLAYSRPGYGDSEWVDDADGVRVSTEAVEVLHQLLAACGVAAPVLLVGHSLGGLYISKYAATYAGEVAGLVYVDGRPATFRAGCDRAAISFCGAEGGINPRPDWPVHINAESAGLRPTEQVAPAMALIAHIPAIVIVSTSVWPGEQGAEGFAVWQEEQAALARGFAHGRLVRAEGAGHYIQREQPALVASEIETLWRG